MGPTISLIVACSALAILTFIMGFYMLFVRVGQMKKNKIHPQSIATSHERSQAFVDTRASDNFNHLFELPVLFYALCALAIASQQIPTWMPLAAWVFVGSRYLHSVVQCTSNKVRHRFLVFVFGFLLLAAMWVGFLLSKLSMISAVAA